MSGLAAKIRVLIPLCVVASSSVAVIGTSPAAAAPLACRAEQSPSAAGFTVSWTGTQPGATRLVIERNAFGEWNWRGRADPSASSFVDTEPGPGAIQLDYRVKALRADRSVISVVDCTVAFRRSFGCSSRTFELGSTHARWDIFDGADVDYVVSMKAATSDRYWWQNRTEATSFRTPQTTDQRQPKVRVSVRDGRRIVGQAFCVEWNTVTTSQLLCDGRYDYFFETFRGIRSTIAFAPDPVDTVVDWYRQTERGGPWELRFSRPNVIASFNTDALPAGADPAEVLYRIELWSEDHSTLLNTAICDAGPRSNRT